MPSITFHNVSFYYREPYAEVFSDVSFRVDSAWKTALIGRNGRGKTTLLNLLCSQLQPSGGHISAPVSTHYFPHQPTDLGLSTRDTVKDAVAPYRVWQSEMGKLLQSDREADLSRYGSMP